MNMTLKRKLFEPREIKEMFPLDIEEFFAALGDVSGFRGGLRLQERK